MKHFEIREPTNKLKTFGTETFIERTIPILITPRSIAALHMSKDEVQDAQTENGGVYDFDCEVVIEPQLWDDDPGSTDEVYIEDYVVLGINDVELGPDDAAMLRDALGELTDKEQDNIKQAILDNRQEDREERVAREMDNYYDRSYYDRSYHDSLK